MMDYLVISFYRYTKIEDPLNLRDQLRQTCQALLVLGRVLISEEGINGAVSGLKQDILFFKKELQEKFGFGGITFREQNSDRCVYHRLVIKVRREICAFNAPVNVANRGGTISPKVLKNWYDHQEDFVIVDARNDYEYAVGHFKNALSLSIKNFREFAQKALSVLQSIKDKKIVLYCTGGIRCEKASAYLKEQGFPKVYHVEGGIINYVNQFPDTYWEGSLFAFDDRLTSPVGKPLSTCVHCQSMCSQYINCHNLDCDRLIVCCETCQEKMWMTCSESCKKAPWQRRSASPKPFSQIVGSIENYYAKRGIAQMKLKKSTISRGKSIKISGKTTLPMVQEIIQLRDEQGNDIISASEGMSVTFPVSQRVRKNGVVVLK